MRRLIRSLTRSVVKGASCLGDRAPARISAITWANCLDHATTGSAVPSAGWPALNVREGPGGSAFSAAPRSRWAHGLGTDTSRAAGHAVPCTSQSYGGQPPGTSTRRSPPKAGAGARPDGAADGGSAGGPALPAGGGEVADLRDDPAGAGSGVRADGMFRLPVRRMRTTANAHGGIRILSGCTWLYLRPPTFWRPGWSLTLHRLDKRRSRRRQIAV